MSEQRPEPNDAPLESDQVLSQALTHIETVTFGIDIDTSSQQIIEKTAAEQRRYDETKSLELQQVIESLNRLARKALGNYYRSPPDTFSTTFQAPEDWLLFRKFFVSITPDDTTQSNYGLLVNKDTYYTAKNRHPFAAAIIAQNPVVVEGSLWQDTLAIVDSNSGVATQARNGSWTVSSDGYARHRNGFFSQVILKSFTRTDTHFVRFRTQESLLQDVSVPSNQEITDAYDPAEKEFTFNPLQFIRHNATVTAYDIKTVRSLLPATLANFPDFFANFLAFISSGEYFNEEETVAELERVANILDKYKDDLDIVH